MLAAFFVHVPGLTAASRGAALPRLDAALASSRGPLVVEVAEEGGRVEDWDAEDLSEACRGAGATAMLLPVGLLEVVAAEQERAVSSYPGPLPLIGDLRGAALAPGTEELAALRAAGASAVAVRAEVEGCDGELIGAARGVGLELVALTADAALGPPLEAAGACAVVYEQGPPLEAEEPEEAEEAEADESADEEAACAHRAVRLASWAGDADSLDELREQGASALLLCDACAGNVARGTARCAALIRLSLSKHSRVYGGSMFGTMGDGAPPQVRNRRLWDQSQRQAREIMHDSATSRGLPPPTLKK